MRFEPLALPGVLLVHADPVGDARGAFARLHCEREFGQQGLPGRMVQTSLSSTRERGTVRGMHFQWPPSREGKLVRCVGGAIHDVVIDLRPDSPTFRHHLSVELAPEPLSAVFIPPGFAHGFQTLADDVQVLYQMTDFYDPQRAAGVRWNDPAFGIVWPLPLTAIHERDAAYPDFDAARFAAELQSRGGGF